MVRELWARLLGNSCQTSNRSSAKFITALGQHFAYPALQQSLLAPEMEAAGTLANYLPAPDALVDPGERAVYQSWLAHLDATDVSAIADGTGQEVLVVPVLYTVDVDDAEDALARPAVARLMAEWLTDNPPSGWAVTSAAAQIARGRLQRLPVSQMLLTVMHVDVSPPKL